MPGFESTESPSFATSGTGLNLAPTAVKTANYTAAAGDLVLCNTSGGAFTVTLPTAPADKATVGIKLTTAGNTLSLALGGSDVFNKAGGVTTGSLSLLNQAIVLQYQATGAIWYVVTDDLPLTALDARYAASGAGALAIGGPSNFRRWHSKLAAVRVGTGNAKVLCVGDSITAGGAPITTGVSTNPYPARLASLLNAHLVPTSLAYWNHKGDLTADSRMVASGSWAVSVFGMGGGGALIGAGQSGTLAFTPGFNTDTVEVYYTSASGWGAVTVNANGGASLGTIDANNATTAFRVATFTTTLGANTWNIVASAISSNMLISAIRAYDSTTKQVHIANFGRGGTKTGNVFPDWSSTGGTGQLDAIAAVAPDLSIICLGINDASVPVATATYLANLTTIVNKCLLTGDVLLLSFAPTDGGTYPVSVTNETLYVAALPALAASLGVGYLDAPWGRWGGSFALANAVGFMADQLHPSLTGYSDWAQAIFAALLTT